MSPTSHGLLWGEQGGKYQLPEPKYTFASMRGATQIPSAWEQHAPIPHSWEKSSLQKGPHQRNYYKSLMSTSNTNPIFKEA